MSTGPRLLAVSDLHIGHPENRAIVERLRPADPADWLIVAGDVAELMADVQWALRLLASRFATVIWVPGNHELWTHPKDPCTLRGVERYQHIVDFCREIGVHTPEDPFPVFNGTTVAPLFTLYDYTFRPEGTHTKEQGLKVAYDSGVVCTDEYVLHPDPYPTRDAWSAARVEYTRGRLAEVTGPTVLINHWPLVREPTLVLHYPEFAQWCGTTATANWPTEFNAAVVVYGHLHIPRTIEVNGIPHVEASVGYPREWRRHGVRPELYIDVFAPVRPKLENVTALFGE